MTSLRGKLLLLILPVLIGMTGCQGANSQVNNEPKPSNSPSIEATTIPEKPVSPGMTRSEVLRILGPPEETEEAAISPERCDYFLINENGSVRHFLVWYTNEVVGYATWGSPEGCYLSIE